MLVTPEGYPHSLGAAQAPAAGYPATMPEFHIVEARPRNDWVYDQLHQLEVAVTTEILGEDLALAADWTSASYADERTAMKGLLLALPGPVPPDALIGRFGLPEAPAAPVAPLASLELTLPTVDNQRLMDDVYAQVRADVRRRGIGSALWREAARIAEAHDRDSIIAWTQHLAGAAGDPERVTPPTGAGHLPVDGATRFAQSLGLELGQVERHSRLQLPVSPQLLAELRAAAEARALPTYELASWLGPVPTEHLDRVAVMNATLSTDAPIGGLDWAPEIWDAERVRHSDERSHLTGHSVVTLALHAATGEAAGLTVLHVHEAHPHRPEQWTTVVAGAHRGHRLGQLIKVANLQLLADSEPAARYVDTWNAGENDHMLAINTMIGFRLHAMIGAWQWRAGERSGSETIGSS